MRCLPDLRLVALRVALYPVLLNLVGLYLGLEGLYLGLAVRLVALSQVPLSRVVPLAALFRVPQGRVVPVLDTAIQTFASAYHLGDPFVLYYCFFSSCPGGGQVVNRSCCYHPRLPRHHLLPQFGAEVYSASSCG